MSDPNQSGDPLASSLAGEPGMLDLIEQFVNELPERLTAIQQTLASHDLEGLSQLAHQLKGSAGGYGYPALSHQAAEIETSVKSHDDIARIAREVRELADLCSRTRCAG